MDYKFVIEELFLDPDNFDRYLDYQKYSPYDGYILEDNFFTDFNLNLFKKYPDDYEKLFLSGFPVEIHPFVSYFAFCRHFKLFPFDKERLNYLSSCSNCAFNGFDEEGKELCNQKSNVLSSCDSHSFSLNDYKYIFSYMTYKQR